MKSAAAAAAGCLLMGAAGLYDIGWSIPLPDAPHTEMDVQPDVVLCSQCPAVLHQRWRTPTCLVTRGRITPSTPSSAISATRGSHSASHRWSAVKQMGSGRSPRCNAPKVSRLCVNTPSFWFPAVTQTSSFWGFFSVFCSESQKKDTAEEQEERSSRQKASLKRKKGQFLNLEEHLQHTEIQFSEDELKV